MYDLTFVCNVSGMLQKGILLSANLNKRELLLKKINFEWIKGNNTLRITHDCD